MKILVKSWAKLLQDTKHDSERHEDDAIDIVIGGVSDIPGGNRYKCRYC